MGVFEQTQIAIADGDWKVRLKRTADLVEYITHDRAMSLANELEAEGWKECAAQIRKAAETVRRFPVLRSPLSINAPAHRLDRLFPSRQRSSPMRRPRERRL
jgi:hypothetical protein